MRFLTTLFSFMLAATATAQDPDPRYVIHIEVDRPVLEPGESTEVRLLAGFDSGPRFAMANVATDVLFAGPTHDARFEDAENLAPMDRVWAEPGTVTERGVELIVGVQLQFHSIRADPTDPMPFWIAQLVVPDGPAAPTEPVHLELASQTHNYQVYVQELDSYADQHLDDLVEGGAAITVVPCRADFNGDGAADLFDFLAFFNAFDAGDPLADFDFDGELTVFDFLAFQNRFTAGC